MAPTLRPIAILTTATTLALTTLATAPATATPSSVTFTSAATTGQGPTCRYINESDDPAPIRLGPGKKYRKQAELAPSQDPVRATCAARGRGPEHWVRLKSGEHKGLWVWRNRLQTWSG
jgi:hypothetical protein